MLSGIAALLVCQLAGEALARGLAVAMPGPVIGLILLFIWFLIQGKLGRLSPATIGERPTGQAAQGLLQNLSILFVPAAVGVIDQLGILGAYWVGLSLAVVVSTLLSLVVTVWVFIAVSRWTKGGEAP